MGSCSCGSKTGASAESPRVGHVYRGGRLVKPLQWHRFVAPGLQGRTTYFADGTLGRYTIHRQRPLRSKGILPRVLTIPDGRQRSFEELDEAKAFAAHFDEIVPQCAPVAPVEISPGPAPAPAPGPEPYVPFGLRREELLERYKAALTAAAPLPAALEAKDMNGARCLPWVQLVVDRQRERACMMIANRNGQMDGPQDLIPVLHQAIGSESQEVYVVGGLDAHLKCKALAEVGRGARDRVPTSLADTARYAVAFANTYEAMGVFIAHLHPSGEVRPSEADDDVTATMKEMCDANGLLFVDHLIIGSPDHAPATVKYTDLEGRAQEAGFYSYRDHGRLKE